MAIVDLDWKDWRAEYERQFPQAFENDWRLAIAQAAFLAGKSAGRKAAPAVEVDEAMVSELERLRALINSPELHDFAKGVTLEAAHQRERWGSDHDAGKEPQDWFWLVGYLGGKALRAHLDGNSEKALHHTISTAAALCNWHGAITGTHNMRPGIDGEAALTAALGREGGGNG